MARTIQGRIALHDVGYSAPADGKAIRAMVGLLVEHGTDLRASDAYGRMPIHHAAANSVREAVLALIESGCAVDLSSAAGETALSLSILARQPDLRLIGQLLERGANARLTDVTGRSPLDLAETSGDSRMVALFRENGQSSSAR